MTCAACNLPINDQAESYFWGRHGGEWHWRCYADMQLKPFRERSYVIGMWKGKGDYGLAGNPPEFSTYVNGFSDGAGI